MLGAVLALAVLVPATPALAGQSCTVVGIADGALHRANDQGAAGRDRRAQWVITARHAATLGS